MSVQLSNQTWSPIRVAVRGALLVFVAYATWTVVRGYWRAGDVHREVAEAYDFVIDHAGVPPYLPCFCGCGRRESHSSLDSCFVSRRDEAGRMVTRDPHAERCKVCVDVALQTKRLLRDGRTLGDIRRTVESKYGADSPLRTNTPEPPATATPVAEQPTR